MAFFGARSGQANPATEKPMAALKERIRATASHAVSVTLPNQIISLSSLIDSFETDPASPFRTVLIDPPSPQQHESGLRERKRQRLELDDEPEPGNRYSNPCLNQALEIVRVHIENLIAWTQAVRLDLGLSKPDFDCEHRISELTKAGDAAHSMLEAEYNYHARRSTAVLSMLQNRGVDDYAMVVNDIDRDAFRSCRQQILDVRDLSLFIFALLTSATHPALLGAV